MAEIKRSVYVNGALFESGMKILEEKIGPEPFRPRNYEACARQRFLSELKSEAAENEEKG